MLAYTLRRVGQLLAMLVVVSMLCSFLIQLPPGNILTAAITSLHSEPFTDEDIAAMQSYAIDRPPPVQYLRWVGGILLHGDWGYSIEWRMPVGNLLWEPVALSTLLTVATLLLASVATIPLGIYSATHPTAFVSRGLGRLRHLEGTRSGFLLALLVGWLALAVFGRDVDRLFSDAFAQPPWSAARWAALLRLVWLPIVVLALGFIADLLPAVRASLLRELQGPYVEAARARGLAEPALVTKYPLRVALASVLSSSGRHLANLVSGLTLVTITLRLRGTGAFLLRAALSEDLYLAGSLVLLLSALTLAGSFLFALLSASLDPRVRQGARGA